jgi:RNA polymerase sigma factor (sigma-70 family)
MNSHPSARATDPLLRPLLADIDDSEWERLSARLVAEHVEPIVKGVVARRLGRSARRREGADADVEDVRAEVVLRLLTRLRNLRHETEPIADLHSYVAVSAFNACDEHLRRKYPQRARLKHRLRYVLTHRPEFALWQDGAGEWQAGLAAWKGGRAAGDVLQLQRLRDQPREAARGFPGLDGQSREPGPLLGALFEAVRQPIGLDDLVGIVAELWGIRDPTSAERARRDEDPVEVEQLPDPRPSAAVTIDLRLHLERLWQEIRELPLRQRAALLLNLRDARGNGFLDLLPLTGVASLADLAGALEVPLAELARLWNEMPLEDAAVAARLGLTRQQVINLRKSARERLARRMRARGF